MCGLCEKFGEVVGVGPGLLDPALPSPPPSTRELLHTTHEMVLLLIHVIFFLTTTHQKTHQKTS